MGLEVGDVMKEQSVGLKVGDVMERTKCRAGGSRRNGKNQVVGLKVGDVMEGTKW